jgi:hypothetical protein
MLSVYVAVRVRPFPKLPPLEENGCGPSTLISPAWNVKASLRLTPCHWKPSWKTQLLRAAEYGRPGRHRVPRQFRVMSIR